MDDAEIERLTEQILAEYRSMGGTFGDDLVRRLVRRQLVMIEMPSAAAALEGELLDRQIAFFEIAAPYRQLGSGRRGPFRRRVQARRSDTRPGHRLVNTLSTYAKARSRPPLSGWPRLSLPKAAGGCHVDDPGVGYAHDFTTARVGIGIGGALHAPALRSWRRWTDAPLLILAIGSLPILLLEVNRSDMTPGDRTLLDVVNVVVFVAFIVDYVVELTVATERATYVRREWTSLLIVVSQGIALFPKFAATGVLRVLRAGRAGRGLAVVGRLIAIGGAASKEGRRIIRRHAAGFALGAAGMTWLSSALRSRSPRTLEPMDGCTRSSTRSGGRRRP